MTAARERDDLLTLAEPTFAVLRQLYHVGWNATLPARGRLPPNPTGPARRSPVVQRLDAPPGQPRRWPTSSAAPAKRSDNALPRCCGSTAPIRSPPTPTSRPRATRAVATR